MKRIVRAKRIGRILAASTSTANKLALLRAEAGSQRDIKLAVGKVDVTLSTDTLSFDYFTFFGAILDRHFDGPVEDSLVLDIGAHKGYWAARTLADGAHEVHSFEPASQNLSPLNEAAGPEARWTIHPVAVGPHDGTAVLNLAEGSWGHSLDTPVGGMSTGVEQVEVVSLRSVLSAYASDRPTVVKINVEGLAGPMILATAARDWGNVQYIWADIEANDSVGANAITRHLATCGLELAKVDNNRHLFVPR